MFQKALVTGFCRDVIRKWCYPKVFISEVPFKQLDGKGFFPIMGWCLVTLKVAITQRETGRKNYITQIKDLKEKDEHFNVIFDKFCIHSLDINILTELVQYVLRKLNLTEPSGSTISDCLYAFASYSILTKSKSKRKTVDTSPDKNKAVMTRGWLLINYSMVTVMKS